LSRTAAGRMRMRRISLGRRTSILIASPTHLIKNKKAMLSAMLLNSDVINSKAPNYATTRPKIQLPASDRALLFWAACLPARLLFAYTSRCAFRPSRASPPRSSARAGSRTRTSHRTASSALPRGGARCGRGTARSGSSTRSPATATRSSPMCCSLRSRGRLDRL
jgi:hypothetical protein